jgi:ADP-glucose pyrophosphorylase
VIASGDGVYKLDYHKVLSTILQRRPTLRLCASSFPHRKT